MDLLRNLFKLCRPESEMTIGIVTPCLAWRSAFPFPCRHRMNHFKKGKPAVPASSCRELPLLAIDDSDAVGSRACLVHILHSIYVDKISM